MAQFQGLLDAHAGTPQDVDDLPGPEGAFLLPGQISAPAGGGIVGLCLRGAGEAGSGGLKLLLDGANQGRGRGFGTCQMQRTPGEHAR